MSATLRYEPGSYRDRDGRVFHDDSGRVLRALSEHALADWDYVRKTAFFQREVERGRIVKTELARDLPDNGDIVAEGWKGVLHHEAIRFVSYPFEWTFGMLQDAAILHLELLIAALEDDVTLKDGTAYNVQWSGVRPVFIDVASFERLEAGRPWTGYRQFCQTFLYPLFFQAYKDIPFQPWLRGRLEGISPGECHRVMSLRDFCRRGVVSHVVLHAWLESRKTLSDIDSLRALPAAGFHKDLIRTNATNLVKIVRGLRWAPAASEWSEYGDSNNYSSADRQRKEQFVRGVVHSRPWRLCWDLGCNTGTYSRIAAENAETVVAMDADHLSVERLYQSLRQEGGGVSEKILPLVISLADPTCGLGWRGNERKAIVDRGRPQLALCLALIHHLVIGAGIPLRELVAWLASLDANLVIEFVSKGDPMVRRLLQGRRDNYSDYDPAHFERLLSAKFDIVRSETLESGTRTLYHAAPRFAP
jgi:hypothetical protein